MTTWAGTGLGQAMARRACIPRTPRLGRRHFPALTPQEPVTVMAANRTFSIIKPDATRRNLTGAVTKTTAPACPK